MIYKKFNNLKRTFLFSHRYFTNEYEHVNTYVPNAKYVPNKIKIIPEFLHKWSLKCIFVERKKGRKIFVTPRAFRPDFRIGQGLLLATGQSSSFLIVRLGSSF